MLNHPWLNMESNFNSRLTPEELKEELEKEKEQEENDQIANDFKDMKEEVRAEMSKLELSEKDLN